MSTVTVIAKATAKEGSEANFEKTIREAIKPTHAEKGCIKYGLHQSLESPRVFYMIEKWDSKESLDQHLKSAHIQTLFTKLPAFLAGPIEIQALQHIPEGDPHKSGI